MVKVRRKAIRQYAMNPELRELVDAARSLPCEASRRAMIKAFHRVAGHRLWINRRDLVREFELPRQVQLASRLIEQMSVAEARAALMARLGFGQTKAHDLILAALEERERASWQDPREAARQQLALALALEGDGKD